MADLFDVGSAEAEIERVLCVIAECHVYKIPPRQTSQGHRAADWNGNHLWTGRCRVVGKGEVCEIKLEDPQTGNLFAACPVTLPGPDQAPSVEPVMDSSRYFVLRIEDGTGKHAFIGMGFTDRSHAFDFNAAIQDFRRELNAEKEAAAKPKDDGPKLDLTLKEGQTIKVKIGGAKAGGAKKKAPAPAAGDDLFGGLLAPPPANPSSAGASAAAAAAADFGDFGDFAAAPAPAPAGGGAPGGEDDWTSFDD